MSVSFKDKNILIDGKPAYIFSGEIQNFRLPYDQWKDRLEKMKAMGLNAVGTYFAWNFHSTAPGEADFTSPQRDIGHFLDLAAEAGLYVVARPGPYICNEWDLGGYPGWLLSEESGDWRTKDPDHLKFCRQWYEAVNARIAPRQQTKGGPVILYQVENEHFWGEKGLMEDLALQAGRDGIEIPLISNGGGSVYETDTKYITDGIDVYTPVYELWRWRGWFDKLYRMLPADAPLLMVEYRGGSNRYWGELPLNEASFPSEWLVTSTGMFMGKGANLTNFFVGAGGITPPGYASDHMCTNYMEDAAISHWGGLGRKFYLVRLWAEAVNSVNESFSLSKPWDIGWGTDNPNVECMARTGTEGTFFFAFNNTRKLREFKILLPDGSALPHKGYMRIKPKSTQLLMADRKLTEKTKLLFCSTQILKLWQNAEEISLVVYGEEGEQGSALISSGEEETILDYTCSAKVNVNRLICEDCRIVLYSVTAELAETTWFGETEGTKFPLFSNIDLIRATKDKNGCLRAEIQAKKTAEIIAPVAEIVINGSTLRGIPIHEGLSRFSFKSAVQNGTELQIGISFHREESNCWRTEEVAGKCGWKKIVSLDGRRDCLLQTGYYQYRTDFLVEEEGELPATLEFTGLTGVEAEFYLNGCKLGVFPDKRPGAYHSLKDFHVSFGVEGIIKRGLNQLAVACILIGRHNLGRYIFCGINRPAVLYRNRKELSLPLWKEAERKAVPTEYKELMQVPVQAGKEYDDSSWNTVDVSRARNISTEEDFTNWHDVQWYRSSCKIPEKMAGQKLFLQLPRVAEAYVYIDGQLAGLINEHHSPILDLSEFSDREEICIAIAIRYTNCFRPCALTEAPFLFTADTVITEWYLRREEEAEVLSETGEGWESGEVSKEVARAWFRYEALIKRPKHLIAPLYVELGENWRTNATIYWNGYALGMYDEVGPDRKFYIQDAIIKEVNTLMIVAGGHGTAVKEGSVKLGAYEEYAPLSILPKAQIRGKSTGSIPLSPKET